MPKAILFEVPNVEEASRTKTLIMVMVAYFICGPLVLTVTSLAGAGAKGGKGADLILCCATEGTGSYPGVNNTRIMYNEAYDTSTKCEKPVLLDDYVDSKLGSWMKDYTVLDKHMHTAVAGFVTPLVQTLVIPVVIMLFAFIGLKMRETDSKRPPSNVPVERCCGPRGWMCTFCIMGFVCGAFGVIGLGLGLITLMVASGSMQSFFPARAGSWGETKNYEAFTVCVNKADGTMGPSYAGYAFAVIACVLWFFLAICSCKLYNLYAPGETDNVTGVQVIQSQTPVIVAVAAPVQPATVVKATVVKATVVKASVVPSAVVKAKVVGSSNV